MAGLFHEFFAHLNDTGVARTSHFQFSLPSYPLALDTVFPFAGRTLTMRCETTDLPGRQLATQDSKLYGPTYKTPYQALYQEITLGFIETEDFFIRSFFDAWLESIWESQNNVLNYPNTYRLDATITQYAMAVEQGASTLPAIATWKLIDAFPTAVNQMPVSWTEDSFHRVAVTFAYQYYEFTQSELPPKRMKPVEPVSPQEKNKGSIEI